MKGMLDQSQGSAKRTYLVRFLHEYSHNEQCDPNKHLQLLETPKIIEDIFSFIQEIDCDHYKAMCEALNVSPLPKPVVTNGSVENTELEPNETTSSE